MKVSNRFFEIIFNEDGTALVNSLASGEMLTLKNTEVHELYKMLAQVYDE